MKVLWPLVGCSSADPLEGGYSFLDRNNKGVLHPGLDLNAGAGGNSDCGAPVVAPVIGTLERVITGVKNGFGNHIYLRTDLRTDEAPEGYLLHFCHLQGTALAQGARVAQGTAIGVCGRTSGWEAFGGASWDFCHTHFEVLKRTPAAANWEFWPTGWVSAQVLDLYCDPAVWLTTYVDLDAVPRVDVVPRADARPRLEEDDVPLAKISDEDLKRYLEMLGTPVNPASAIVKRAMLAYRRGETRGPAVSDEYKATTADGRQVVRQRFSAGIAEYDPASGEVNWVELVLHPDAIN